VETTTTPRDEKAAVNWKIRRTVRRGLKIAAAQCDTTSEAYADRVLGEHLERHGLMPAEPASIRPVA
jgi:hypothetical protein